MSKKESVQKRLQRVRPPRVQLTYDVEIGDAVEQKELPFVVGVIGDYAGQSLQPQGKVRDRKFVSVDLDNFDDVMAGVAPRAAYRVKNRLSDEGGEFVVDLGFQAFEDFRPEAVVARVEPLRKLMEARSRLADLRNKLAGNERLEDLLGEALHNTDELAALGRRRADGDQEGGQ